MDRICFSDKSYLKEFFNNIKQNSRLSWNGIASYIGTTRSMLYNYHIGKLMLPENRFQKLLELISQDKKEYFSKLTIKKNKNWGQIIGGRKAYIINKKSFDEGRKKARRNSVKYNFDINLPLSEDICEFIGVVIGDGFTNKYGHIYQTQITGDQILDLEYYQNTLRPICERQFKICPKIANAARGLRFNIYSKRVFELLTQRFKIPAGVKCYSVKIPEEILKSNQKMLAATLKGMFNTDGGVGLDRRKVYKKPYIRINYTSASEELISQLHNILLQLNIPHSVNTNSNSNRKTQVIQINGENNVKRFIDKIGFSNPRHLKKIRYLL